MSETTVPGSLGSRVEPWPTGRTLTDFLPPSPPRPAHRANSVSANDSSQRESRRPAGSSGQDGPFGPAAAICTPTHAQLRRRGGRRANDQLKRKVNEFRRRRGVLDTLQ